MPIQTKLSRGRIVRLDTAAGANGDAPTDGVTLPTFIMSPKTSTGLLTTGLGLGLKAPAVGAATPDAAGFSVQLYLLNPYTFAWFSGAAGSKQFGEFWSTYDFNAAGIYVQFLAAGTAADGLVDVHFWEQ